MYENEKPYINKKFNYSHKITDIFCFGLYRTQCNTETIVTMLLLEINNPELKHQWL